MIDLNQWNPYQYSQQDSQDIFVICSRIFQLINELLLGPNLKNQLAIYKQPVLQLHQILKCRKYDMNNDFFNDLQAQVIDYIQHLSYGGNQKIIDHITSILDPYTIG